MNLSLFSSLEQIKKEECFLNKTLQINTHINGNSIDELFDNCQRELEAYAIPNHNYTDDKYPKAFPSSDTPPINITRFNQLLKENCVIATYYSLRSLKYKDSFTAYDKLVNHYIPQKLDYSTSKQIKRCYSTSWRNSKNSSYLNRLILRNDSECLSDFCQDLSLQLVLNNSRGASVLNEEHDEIMSSFEIFKLDDYLNSFKLNIPWTSRIREAQIKHIKNLLKGIESVASNWFPNVSDEICYLYRKEYIFHYKAILDFFTCTTRNKDTLDLELNYTHSDSGIPILSDFQKSNIDYYGGEWDIWLDLLYNYTRLPLYHRLGEMVLSNQYLLFNDVIGTTYVRIPVLFKTFFIALYTQFQTIDKAIAFVDNYITESNLLDSMYFSKTWDIDNEQWETKLECLYNYCDNSLKALEATFLQVFKYITPFTLCPYENSIKQDKNLTAIFYILNTVHGISIPDFKPFPDKYELK